MYLFRITHQLLGEIHADLSRPHAFAFERVGFIRCRIGTGDGVQIILAEAYSPVADDDYLKCAHMGALMGPAAIRKALQEAYVSRASMFHVHRHEHAGNPAFSQVDVRENAKFIPDFFKVAATKPHGAIVLSRDGAYGAVWDPTTRQSVQFKEMTSIGFPLRRLGRAHG